MLILALLSFSAVPLKAQNWWNPTITSSRNYTVESNGNGIRVDEGYWWNPWVNYDGIGSISVGNGYNVTITFNTNAPVQLNGTITCTQGTLTLNNQGQTHNGATIIRYGSNNMTNEANAFIRTDLGNNNPNNIHVNIQGSPEHQFVIDGNCSMRLVEATDPSGNGRPFYNFVKNSGGSNIKAPIMFIQGGYVNLDYVTIRNHWKDGNAGAGITIKSDPDSQIRASYVTVDHSLFEWLRAIDHGGAIYLNNKSSYTNGSNFELKNSEIRNCYVYDDGGFNEIMTKGGGGGGAIRSMGENRCEMTIDNCSIHDCYTNCDGGGIRWNSVLIPPLEIKNGTEVYNNWAFRYGGGMRVDALADVEGCTFDNNRADYGGGGISLGVFNSGNENHLNANGGRWDPNDGILTLDASTVISNNWSGENGGGLHFQCDFIEFPNGLVKFYRHANGEYFKVQLNVNGATVRDNTAEKDGGGVYMNRTTNFYGLEAHLNFGNIENNTANGNGGGLALTEQLDPNYTVRPGQSYTDPSLGITWNDIVAQPIQARVGTMKPSWQNELLTMKSNTAINGGGVYIDGGDLVMVKGLVSENKADNPNGSDGNGGGYYVVGGTVAVHGGTITENTAERYGGGYYVSVNDEVVINNDSTSAIISNNTAYRGGGAYIDKGQLKIEENEIIEGSETSVFGNNASNQGGGIYLYGDNGTGSFSLLGGSIGKEGHPNYSNATGGGAYVNNGEFLIEGGALSYNTSRTGGGGAYVNRGNVTIINGNVNYNDTENSSANGGGIYANQGKVNIKSTSFIGNIAKSLGGGIFATGPQTEIEIDRLNVSSDYSLFDSNVAAQGGGLYARGKKVDVNHTTFTDNKAQGTNSSRGGGIFVTKPTDAEYIPEINLYSGTTIQNNSATVHGGGLFFESGNITLSGPVITGNVANSNGGGIYIGDGTILVKDNTKIGTYETNKETHGSANTAVRGGGIYLNGGSVNFLGGIFAGNYATTEGGGIYINNGATLNLKDEAEIKDNHVDANGRGGGVFMNGTFNLGGGSADDKQTLKAYTNYAGESYSEATQNNVYLPSNSKYITLKSDISEQSDEHTYITKIGITTNPNQPHPHPVVFVENVDTEEEWLYKLMNRITAGNGSVFDDTETHIAIHTREDYPSQGFETKYLYFDGCWTTAVNKNPQANLGQYPLPEGVTQHYTADEDGWHIYTPEGLAWFISYVNNLNGCTGDNRGTNAFIEADIDMSANRWVPIGAVTSYDVASSIFVESDAQGDHYYTGTFDGQGYLVTGIKNGFLSGISLYGMFGATKGTLKNIFLDSYSNVAANVAANHGYTYYMGGVAGSATSGTISNCEARGTMESENWQNTIIGGLVGLVDGEAVHIHSSMAMPIMSGKAQAMGGLVGEIEAGDLKNSFSNASITTSNNGTKVGGLVGINNGTVENCYVRLQGTEPNRFGWFAGQNNGTITICYAPDGKTNYVRNGSDPTNHGNYEATALVSSKYGFAHSDQEVTASNSFVENGPVDDNGELKGLLATLNNWVEQNEGYSTWTRTMASPMNDDYPILEFDDFVSAGSKDNIYLLYRADLNDMLDLVNRDNLETAIGLMNGDYAGGRIYLYDTNPTVVNTNTGTDVRVYIAPNIGILQAKGNKLDARVGVAFDNTDKSWLGGAPYDWHMFSSALEAAPMGLLYHSDQASYSIRDQYASLTSNGIPHTDWSNVNFMDPPKTEWFQSDDNTAVTYAPNKIGYFPTDSPYGNWRETTDSRGSFDFYFYSEEYYHWINFKREGAIGIKSTLGYDFLDHWHEDEDANNIHHHIPYENEEEMVVGKGYLLAVSEPSILMADGVLNNEKNGEQLTTPVTKSNLYGYEEPLIGINMVGNPFQSYLNADEFLSQNGLNTYYILDADAKAYIPYTVSSSTPDSDEDDEETFSAPQLLHPHQAFLVHVESTGDLLFTNEMREAEGTSDSYFRNQTPHYPMVNMICSDEEGRNDIAIIELDRPELGGGEKIKGLRSGDASIWFRLDEKDLQIAFAPVGTTNVPLRFRAYNDGVYSLRWNTANADFHYLHLIDNITGADINCLTTKEYVFEGKTTDYKSRFRLVFDFTGIEENEESSSTELMTFAFQRGNEVIVNGEGVLEIFDMSGRMVMGREIYGDQSRITLPTVANGMYVLRLTEAKQVKVQKMFINK